MNEEEKEAIEYLKRYSNTGLWYKQQHYEYIKIVIRLVEKLQKENEEYKELAEMNLKNAEEFKNNMCEHRCLLKSENKEQKELIEKMKIFLLKENKMWDFLESEE